MAYKEPCCGDGEHFYIKNGKLRLKLPLQTINECVSGAELIALILETISSDNSSLIAALYHKQTITVDDKADGWEFGHLLKGLVKGEFFLSDGTPDPSVGIEILTNSSAKLKLPVYDDEENVTVTGYLLLTKII